MVELTNREHEIVALAAIEFGIGRHMTLLDIWDHCIGSDDDIGRLVRKRRPRGIHFFRCCIPAGIIDWTDLPPTIRWSGLKQKPCYRIPHLWYTEAYGGSRKTIPHGHLTDYIGRTLPQYLTTQTFDVYMSALNDRHKRYIATILLDSSRNSYHLDETMKVIALHTQEALPYYEQFSEGAGQIFVSHLLRNSIKKIPDAVKLAYGTTFGTINAPKQGRKQGKSKV